MKAARTRKVQTNKTNYMSDEAFADLKEAMEGVLAFERGERRDLKVTRIQAPQLSKAMSPKDIARIREKLNCSQAVFAMMLNISPKTVQAWEQGSREPVPPQEYESSSQSERSSSAAHKMRNKGTCRHNSNRTCPQRDCPRARS